MLSNETKLDMQRTLKEKGEKYIVLHAVEELAELAKVLLKNVNRGKDNRDKIIDEMSDVKFRIEYLKIIYGVTDDELDDCINKKTIKLNGRISK